MTTSPPFCTVVIQDSPSADIVLSDTQWSHVSRPQGVGMGVGCRNALPKWRAVSSRRHRSVHGKTRNGSGSSSTAKGATLPAVAIAP